MATLASSNCDSLSRSFTSQTSPVVLCIIKYLYMAYRLHYGSVMQSNADIRSDWKYEIVELQYLEEQQWTLFIIGDAGTKIPHWSGRRASCLREATLLVLQGLSAQRLIFESQ
jgi:hypothetical protein